MIRTLFEQGITPLAVQSVWGGEPGVPGGLTLDLWSHTGASYPLSPSAWDIGALTGVGHEEVAQQLAVAPGFGATTLQVGANGTVGAVIDSASLIALQPITPVAPMPAIVGWTPQEMIPLAADQTLTLSVDLQVPVAAGQLYGSSSQAVLYLLLSDVSSGVHLALGLSVFDSRGAPQGTLIGTDGGLHGTGDSMIIVPAGRETDLYLGGLAAEAGSSAAQGSAWTGWRHFSLRETPATLERVLWLESRITRGVSSLNPADWCLDGVSLDTEIEYDGISQAVMGYSANHLTLSISTPDPVGVFGIVSTAEISQGLRLLKNIDDLFIQGQQSTYEDGWLKNFEKMCERDGQLKIAIYNS